MESEKKIKVGPVTLALGLVLGGFILLVYNFGGMESLGWLWRLWPLLLVGLGVEYFVRKATAKDLEINFHVPSILLIVLLIFVSGTAAAVTGVSERFGTFIDSGFLDGGHEYSSTWTWNSDPVEVKEGEDRLVINQQIGTISLLPSADGKLHVTSIGKAKSEDVRRALSSNYDPQINRDGQLLRVSVPRPREFEDRDYTVDLTVKVPAGIPVEASSDLGKIDCSELDNDVKVSTKLGALVLRNIAGDIDARTRGGEIKLLDPKGNVLAESDLGTVSLRSQEALSGEYSLKSNLGSVTFRVPKESNLLVDASTDVGDVNVAVPSLNNIATTRSGPSHEAHFQLGEGKGNANIKVNTGSVDITVH